MSLPSFPNVDLFSAGVNALNGVLIARHPSHDRGYAVVGLLIMAYFGGIGGGVTRDVLLADIPSPIKDPAYLLVCLLMGLLGLAIYRYADSKEERFRTRTLAYFKSFTLPWFAILGAHKALEHNLGFWAAIVIGLIATTAGGVFIDVFSGVTPEIVRPSEHSVTRPARIYDSGRERQGAELAPRLLVASFLMTGSAECTIVTIGLPKPRVQLGNQTLELHP